VGSNTDAFGQSGAAEIGRGSHTCLAVVLADRGRRVGSCACAVCWVYLQQRAPPASVENGRGTTRKPKIPGALPPDPRDPPHATNKMCRPRAARDDLKSDRELYA